MGGKGQWKGYATNRNWRDTSEGVALAVGTGPGSWDLAPGTCYGDLYVKDRKPFLRSRMRSRPGTPSGTRRSRGSAISMSIFDPPIIVPLHREVLLNSSIRVRSMSASPYCLPPLLPVADIFSTNVRLAMTMTAHAPPFTADRSRLRTPHSLL